MEGSGETEGSSVWLEVRVCEEEEEEGREG